ncbi:hypothetical protein Tco_0038940 [Tanacetum coccineum]
MVEAMQGTLATGVTDVAELSQRMTDFVTTVRQDTGQQAEIIALRAADHARQAQFVETLRLMSILQTQVTAL